MFNFADLFTPERMAAGHQGVQAINQMPWVFNGYSPAGQTQAPTAAAAPQTPPLSPLQDLLNFGLTPDDITAWMKIIHDPNGRPTQEPGTD